MKKEMLSKVMKKAWEIKKEDRRNIFSVCLKMAWAIIKNGAEDVKEKFEGFAKLTGEVFANCKYVGEGNAFSFSKWEKYGKKRIYMNDHKGKGCGYIDVNNNSMSYMGYAIYKEAMEVFMNLYEF